MLSFLTFKQEKCYNVNFKPFVLCFSSQKQHLIFFARVQYPFKTKIFVMISVAKQKAARRVFKVVSWLSTVL